MLPTLRQRLLILVAILAGGACWIGVGPMLRASDGGSGLSLLGAHSGPVMALLAILLAGLPALGLGLLVAATGHPLAGLFASSMALLMLAVWGGPIDGWMYRATLPDDYLTLAGETLLWFIGVLLMVAVIARLRAPLRARVPALAFNDHLGLDTELRLVPCSQSLGAGLVCTIIAALLGHMLLRNSVSGQVVGSLLVAFTVGAMVAQMNFGQANPLGLLLSPALVAVLAYGYVALRYPDADQVFAGWFSATSSTAAQHLTGLALALPIHYASAGVAGVTLGVGLAHSFETTRTATA